MEGEVGFGSPERIPHNKPLKHVSFCSFPVPMSHYQVHEACNVLGHAEQRYKILLGGSSNRDNGNKVEAV